MSGDIDRDTLHEESRHRLQLFIVSKWRQVPARLILLLWTHTHNALLAMLRNYDYQLLYIWCLVNSNSHVSGWNKIHENTSKTSALQFQIHIIFCLKITGKKWSWMNWEEFLSVWKATKAIFWPPTGFKQEADDGSGFSVKGTSILCEWYPHCRGDYWKAEWDIQTSICTGQLFSMTFKQTTGFLIIFFPSSGASSSATCDNYDKILRKMTLPRASLAMLKSTHQSFFTAAVGVWIT